MAGKALIEKGTPPRASLRTGEPVPGTPVTQEFPLFLGGMLVAAELHSLPNPSDLEKPIEGYKMWSTATGYVWVPKAEGDAMFCAADETNEMIITQALTQGLRVAVPAAPPPPETTTTAAPGVFGASASSAGSSSVSSKR